MDWNLVGLVVIFPISQAIGMGFKRRERALFELGTFLGNLRAIWGAMHSWQVKVKDGRWIDCVTAMVEQGEPHVREDLHVLVNKLLAALVTYFSLPRWGRARHAVACLGAEAEMVELQDITHEQRLVIDGCIAQLQRLVQHAKCIGLPGGEAHRVDSYVSMMGVAFERLTSLKEYRTPQAFRAFARVYILLLGGLYGPYYVYLGNHGATGSYLGLPIAFACCMQFAMSGLFHVMLGLEDPFARRNGRGYGDSVKVAEVVDVTRRQLLRIEHESAQPWNYVASDIVEATKLECAMMQKLEEV